jgi:hypothetical protein
MRRAAGAGQRRGHPGNRRAWTAGASAGKSESIDPAPRQERMSKPAARLTDMHVCPMITVLVPHVGGPIAFPGE